MLLDVPRMILRGSDGGDGVLLIIGLVQAKSMVEAEVKVRCQAQRKGGVGTRGAAAPSAKEMEFFHSMGIAGMLP